MKYHCEYNFSLLTDCFNRMFDCSIGSLWQGIANIWALPDSPLTIAMPLFVIRITFILYLKYHVASGSNKF